MDFTNFISFPFHTFYFSVIYIQIFVYVPQMFVYTRSHIRLLLKSRRYHKVNIQDQSTAPYTMFHAPQHPSLNSWTTYSIPQRPISSSRPSPRTSSLCRLCFMHNPCISFAVNLCNRLSLALSCFPLKTPFCFREWQTNEQNLWTQFIFNLHCMQSELI